ncbi:S46 family peptidase [Undibacterium terreum]|uniref:Dipeptidyl-peptidase n=1 Tax=Undibacterium terreum TaxID=1224302 RepID=A0A916V0K3_9BURK|nr:S46 family peptidase [Undibacterium terreum]GGC98952.1 dipeptidyl-peptidase [Undibacterium terreum]
MKNYWFSKAVPTTLLVILALPNLSCAAEGMWTLDNLPLAKLQSQYGYKPSGEWVKNVMLSSARLALGCSGSFVSKDGLVMTNHHCASECIEQISTAQKNYMNDGFLSKSREAEIVCPAMEVNRLEDIQDVTEQVKKATAGLDGNAYKDAQNAVRAKLTSACVGSDKTSTRCDLVDLYHGGRYHIYKYHRYADVRLVWAPEKAAAFFGGDPDNFMFPRYDLDMSLVRVYENGKPAQIKNFFPFSKNGAEENELVFVTGHPGSTQRQLTVAQLLSLRDIGLVDRLLRLAELRGVIEQYRTTSPEAARTAEGTLFGVENSYKALYGELQTLLDPAFMKKKLEEENALRKFVASKPALQSKVGGAWSAIEKAQEKYRALNVRVSSIEGGRALMSEYFFHARDLVRAADEKIKPDAERLPEYSDARLQEVEEQILSAAPIYPEFEKVKLVFALTKMREKLGPDDAFVKQILGKASPEQLASDLIKRSTLNDPAVRKALWTGGKDAIAKSDDPFIKLVISIDAQARAIRKQYEHEVESVVQKNTELIAQAMFAQSGTSAYPDATFSLRLSYGQVKGWDEAGSKVPAFTDFSGAFARETGADPFALPPSWHAAKGKLNQAQRLNFVTDNDIIGGNSGSPMINRNGEIVGLIFDGNIHSLGGAFWFDQRVNRAVAVHSSGILEALDKIYDAKDLVKEVTTK